jgi:methylated-DNA-[protein]-cysteine S-methyltransferase
MKNVFYYNATIGNLLIEEEDNFIIGVSISDGDELEQIIEKLARETEQIKETEKINETKQVKESDLIKRTYLQLMEYFEGKRTTFDVPIRLNGTAFQTKVWEELRKIPYGETRSYGEIAKQVGVPKGARAVGGANHNNPILIIVPCHRVIGSSGALVGFGAGIPVKEILLKLENQEK